jgi:hypothetical protein
VFFWIKLLKDELKNPNTVVVCVEDADKEFVNSNLVPAIERIYGENGIQSKKNFMRRFVVALNQSDVWLEHTNQRGFVDKLHDYTKKFGLVPVLVGGSIDPANESQNRDSRSASFAKIVEEYKGADEREGNMYDIFFRDWEETQLGNAFARVL